MTGKYWDAAQGKSPVTRFPNNTSLWGASVGEKMSDYVGPGTYQTPNGDPFAGTELPDYPSFCADCHNSSTTLYSPSLGRNLVSFDWTSDKHGGLAAGNQNTSLLAPYQIGLLGQYALSCTDCHEAHGSTNNYALRTVVNGGQVTVTGYGNLPPQYAREWDSLCTKCHTNISDFHHLYYSSTSTPCSDCHGAHGATYVNCTNCHSHPGIVPEPTWTPSATRTPTAAATPTPTVTP